MNSEPEPTHKPAVEATGDGRREETSGGGELYGAPAVDTRHEEPAPYAPEPFGDRGRGRERARHRHRAGFPSLQRPVRMHARAWSKLLENVGRWPAERGGIFVGQSPFYVEDFIFDNSSRHRGAIYEPDADYLNEILERHYEPHGLRFVGVGHSHPAGLWRPSGDDHWGDIKAARNNLLSKSNDYLEALFIPIIESMAETGQFVIHPFLMLREDLQVYTVELELDDPRAGRRRR
ncbi:MAG TPA: Mov34/MPN/PAD-1 family protein [Pyrinomonadaceae bacterium]|jgi:proteasome lid subunit RPN8/RPN11|nr:Mov34/MPN/PAD-1 family protein [Pyrinomonadaceae bacterium]